MIPYLFPEGATSFIGGGYGALTRCVSCTVKQELGSTGVYELEMQILVDDPVFKNMTIGKIIVAKPNLTDTNQAFVIEQMSKPINNVVSVYATHIAQHRARLIPVAPVNASNLTNAIDQILDNSLEPNPFNLHTSRKVAVSYSTDVPRSFRSILGGEEGSLLDVYSGEYIFNNFDIELVTRRGRSSGLQVAYGKNMTSFELNEEFSFTTSVTGILPYWFNEEDGLVQGSAQYSDYADLFKYKKTVAKDYTDKFESKPTVAQLNAKALSEVQSLGMPSINTKIAFKEFNELIKSNSAVLQLGDTVRVINANYGVNSSARIVSMTFNVLGEIYEQLEIGELQMNINKAIQNTVDVKATSGSSLSVTQDTNGNLNIGV